eukprot:Gb_15790 [translate_table: standard]
MKPIYKGALRIDLGAMVFPAAEGASRDVKLVLRIRLLARKDGYELLQKTLPPIFNWQVVGNPISTSQLYRLDFLYGQQELEYKQKHVSKVPVLAMDASCAMQRSLMCYFKCRGKECGVKKQSQRCGDAPEFVLTTYQGTHNHPPKSAISSELRNSYDLRAQLRLPKSSEDRPGDDGE